MPDYHCNWPITTENVSRLFEGVPEEEVHEITWKHGATVYGLDRAEAAEKPWDLE